MVSLGWCTFDELPEPWHSGFVTGAIVAGHPVDHYARTPVTVFGWALGVRRRALTAGGLGLLLLLLLPGIVREGRKNLEALRALFDHTPLTLVLLSCLAVLTARVYYDLLGWGWALEERRLRQRGLHRFGVAVSPDILVARTPEPMYRGKRCLVLPRKSVVKVVAYWHGKNPQEPRERFLKFCCLTEEGGARNFFLPYDMNMDFEDAVRGFNDWARGRGLPASPSEAAAGGTPPRSPHRLALLWLASVLALSAVAWLWPL
ncbi:MAG: hypothetical protein AAF690_18155 [Acidobacteriota bacterium]